MMDTLLASLDQLLSSIPSDLVGPAILLDILFFAAIGNAVKKGKED